MYWEHVLVINAQNYGIRLIFGHDFIKYYPYHRDFSRGLRLPVRHVLWSGCEDHIIWSRFATNTDTVIYSQMINSKKKKNI
jgi:hypothetical protein